LHEKVTSLQVESSKNHSPLITGKNPCTFNAIPNTNHNANPTNLTVTVGNPNPTNPTNPTKSNTRYRCE